MLKGLREHLELMREAAGPDVDILLDLNFNARTEGYLKILRETRDLDLFWVEIDTLDPKALVEYLIPRMPHFMVPRYIRVMDELPKTPTQKVQKHRIRSDGVTADTWDREQAGVVVRRQKIG